MLWLSDTHYPIGEFMHSFSLVFLTGREKSCTLTKPLPSTWPKFILVRVAWNNRDHYYSRWKRCHSLARSPPTPLLLAICQVSRTVPWYPLILHDEGRHWDWENKLPCQNKPKRCNCGSELCFQIFNLLLRWICLKNLKQIQIKNIYRPLYNISDDSIVKWLL